MSTTPITQSTPAQKKRTRKASTATVAEVAAQHLPADSTDAPVSASEGEVIPPANPMADENSAKELAKLASEEFGKRQDTMDSFLSELPKAQANDVRKETKAFISDLKAAGGKLASACVHLYAIFTTLNSATLYNKFGRALVSEGYITGGTFYVLTQKVLAFERLQLADGSTMPQIVRGAFMAYSNGDSVIVRRELTSEEREAWKKDNPTVKVPKGTYDPSKYVIRALEVIEPPAKWTQETADSFAGRVLRLSAKLRAKDRSGADTQGANGDDRKRARFADALDRLQVYLEGKANDDGKITGMIVLSDASEDAQMLSDTCQVVITAALKRISDASLLDALYEDIDNIFTARIEQLKTPVRKAGKVA